MKATFKTIKPTGQWKSFQKDSIRIKINKKEVGYIINETPFKIRLMIFKADINEDGNPNCTWKWITLKKESKTIEETKQFIKDNTEKIIEKFNLRYISE